jgi:hypothetical protein
MGAPGPYHRCGYGYSCERRYYNYYDGPAVTVVPDRHYGWHTRHW